MKRLITGLTLISILFGIMTLDYYFIYGSMSIFKEGMPIIPIFSDLLIWFFLMISVYELYNCYSKNGYTLFKTPLIFVAVAIYPIYFLFEFFKGWGIFGIALTIAIGIILELIFFTFSNKEKYKVNDLFSELSIFLYPILLLSFAFVLSKLTSGIYFVMFATFLAVGSDAFAYWVGVSLHKKFPKQLCPNISPKKTVIGGIGAIFGGIFAAMVFWLFFEVGAISNGANMNIVIAGCNYTQFFAATKISELWKSALVYATIGIVGCVLSEIGDLAASRIKRATGIKDFGTIFPGHGGVIDRLDSILFTIILLSIILPIIYLA